MPNHPTNPRDVPSGGWADAADILNDSISMNMQDDSFDGNESTLILPSNPVAAGPSSFSARLPESSNRSVPSSSQNLEQASSSSTHDSENHPAHPQPPRSSKDQWLSRETARNRELENERDWLKGINQLLETSADEMDKIKEKLGNVQSATQTSHELLDLYSKILTQTEHTRDLLSNPNWEGLTADMERRAERREAERLRLAQEREREAEEEMMRERRKQQLEDEAAAEAARKQSQLYRSTRGTGPAARGRGTAATAGRTVRGKSRIGRIAR